MPARTQHGGVYLLAQADPLTAAPSALRMIPRALFAHPVKSCGTPSVWRFALREIVCVSIGPMCL